MPLLHQFKDKNGKWRWRLKATNGRVLLSGEDYHKKSNADRAKDDILDAMEAALKYYRGAPHYDTEGETIS